MSSALDQVGRALLPLLDILVSDLMSDGNDELLEFFGRIQQSLQRAQTDADLADPFLALITTCEVLAAKDVSPANAVIIDQLLAQAIAISRRLQGPAA